MGDDPLYRDAALARFYDLDNDWGADGAFCLGLARSTRSVLDIGCGTGALALRIAAETGSEVVGVDPAAAMLDLARAKAGAERVTWVEADARGLDLGRQFDLVLMTGHAFQVFLDDHSRAACLLTIARHLAPGGRYVFDSRNPEAAEWRDWTPDASRREIADPVLGTVTAWDEACWDAGRAVVTYRTTYLAEGSGERFAAEAEIGFAARADLARLIDASGLAVESWLGGWDGRPVSPGCPELIPIGGPRP